MWVMVGDGGIADWDGLARLTRMFAMGVAHAKAAPLRGKEWRGGVRGGRDLRRGRGCRDFDLSLRQQVIQQLLSRAGQCLVGARANE